jgi:cell division protein FtsQ
MIMPLRHFWNSPGLIDRVSGVLMGLAVTSLLGLLLFWVSQRPAFAVKRVIVDSIGGEFRHVTPSQLHAAVVETLNGTVLSADLQPIQQSLQAIPWVRKATVRRIWPNRLLVRIEEQQAVATWSKGLLVNTYGQAFAGASEDHDASCMLAALSGPPGSERLVLDRARELQAWVDPLGVSLASLRLTDQYAWNAVLSSGITLDLGRDALGANIEERVRMFVKTQSWLLKRLALEGDASVVHADLRYATGYAFRTGTYHSLLAQSEQICNLGKDSL